MNIPLLASVCLAADRPVAREQAPVLRQERKWRRRALVSSVVESQRAALAGTGTLTQRDNGADISMRSLLDRHRCRAVFGRDPPSYSLISLRMTNRITAPMKALIFNSVSVHSVCHNQRPQIDSRSQFGRRFGPRKMEDQRREVAKRRLVQNVIMVVHNRQCIFALATC